MVTKFTNQPTNKQVVNKINDVIDAKQDELSAGSGISIVEAASTLPLEQTLPLSVVNNIVLIYSNLDTSKTLTVVIEVPYGANMAICGRIDNRYCIGVRNNSSGLTFYDTREIGTAEYNQTTISTSGSNAYYVKFVIYSNYTSDVYYSIDGSSYTQVLANSRSDQKFENYGNLYLYEGGSATYNTILAAYGTDIATTPTISCDNTIARTADLATVATSGSYNDLSNKPTIPTVNNATLTIQKNGTTVKTFTANASSNVTCNITVPTNNNELTNGAGYITGITSSDVTTALGYTPYNSSNPNGYTSNVGTVTKVNNTSPDSNGNVSITIPTVPTNVSSFTNDSGYITSSALSGYLQNTATGSNSLTLLGTAASQDTSVNIGVSSSGAQYGVALGNSASTSARGTALGYNAKTTGANCIQIGSGTNTTASTMAVGFNGTNYQLLDGTTGLIPDDRLSSNIARTANLSTVATSGSYNDLSNKPTIPTVNNATLTIQKNGTTVKTFTANASSNVTANITVPTKVSELTNDSGFTSNTGTVTSVNNVSPVNGNVSLTIPTVNNATLTIQKNGTTVKTFTANASSNVTANITVPTKVSELTNDSGFTSNTGTITGITMNGSSKGTSGVVDLGTVITDISGKQDTLVSGINIKTINGSSILGNGDLTVAGSGGADIDLSNLSATGKTVIDGAWVKSKSDSFANAQSVANSSNTAWSKSVSTYLPDDGQNYLILVSGNVVTGSTSGNYATIEINSDISDDIKLCRAQTRTSGTAQASGAVWLPVGTGRMIYVRRNSSWNGTFTLDLRGYRRIGTNS